MSGGKRRRGVILTAWVSEGENEIIKRRMAEAGTQNCSAFIRKMAMNGFVLNVDLSPVRELVSLQRRCANNMNQIATNVNTYGGIYPQEITALQKDYTELWGRVSDLLKQLAAVTAI